MRLAWLFIWCLFALLVSMGCGFELVLCWVVFVIMMCLVVWVVTDEVTWVIDYLFV